MKYIRRFNESILNAKELEFNDDMMYKTSAILSLTGKNHRDGVDRISSVIETTLTTELYDKLFKEYKQFIRDSFSLFNFFVTSILSIDDLTNMFDNVVIHEGRDGEDEFVSALEINGKIVLLLISPERGNQIRIQDDNFSITVDDVVNIIKTLCEVYNDRLKYYI